MSSEEMTHIYDFGARFHPPLYGKTYCYERLQNKIVEDNQQEV
jgi:hypothetical protein